MTRLRYAAISDTGERVGGLVTARDRRDAVVQLLARGYHPLEVTAVREGAQDVREVFRRLRSRVRTADLAVMTRQFAALLKAGLPVTQSLEALRQQTRNRRLSRVLEEIKDHLAREGGTLAEAMDEHPKVFDGVYRGLVRAGEESGNLTEVLNNLADHLSRAAKLRGQVVGAFIYPAFLLLLGFGAVFVLMTFVIPRFRELFISLGQDLPLATSILLQVSGFLSSWWWVLGLGVLAAGVAAALALRRPAIRLRADRLLLRFPVLGPMLLKIEVARLTRTLSALLRGGVSILQAMGIASRTSSNAAIRRAFPLMIAEVSAGESLAVTASKTGLFPPLMINLVRTGEETGELPQMLLEVSSIYEDEADRAVTGAVRLLEPLLIVLIGAVIAGIVAAVMLPVFQANTMLQ